MKVGDRVRVVGINADGVLLALSDTAATVGFVSTRITCRPEQLLSSVSSPPLPAPLRFTGEMPSGDEVRAPLDLHGCRTEEARTRLEDRIDKALRVGIERFEVIHGLGSGRVKGAIVELLNRHPAVRTVHPTIGNPGSLWVILGEQHD